MKVIILALVFLLAVNAIEEEIDYEQQIKDKYNVSSIQEFKSKFMGLEMQDLLEHFPKANTEHLLQYTSIPSSFDARKQWPGCVTPVRQQENCGSCWAFSGSSVLADRFCIATQGKTRLILSPQYMVSCDYNDHQCQGGQFHTLWQFLESYGTVTEQCMPYVSGSGEYVPSCLGYTCSDYRTYVRPYKASLGSTRVFTSPNEIKLEIMTNGPVQTGFMLYSDLPTYNPYYYPDLVYTRRSSESMGGHAVKIIGWGRSLTVGNYWIAENSWGTDFGEQGYFRIKESECGFGDQAVAGQADVTYYNKFLTKTH